MGLQETFTAVASLPPRDVVRFLDVALAEAHDDLQLRAVDFILSTGRPERLAVLVAHFPDLHAPARTRTESARGQLVAAAEEALKRGPREQRPSAYELLAALGELSLAQILVPGLDDLSARVRHTVSDALRKWLLEFHDHLQDFRRTRNPDSEAFIRNHEHAALAVARALLSRYDNYPEALALKIVVDLGEPAHGVVKEVVLERGEGELHRAFIAAMVRARSPEAMALILHLAAERLSRSRNAAVEIIRRRDDDEFPHDLAAYLISIGPEGRRALAQRMIDAVWWTVVTHAADLSAEEASAFIDFLDGVRIDAVDKAHYLGELRRHKSPAVRAEAFKALARGRDRDVDALALESLDDTDPAVQLAAAQLLVERKTPGLVSRFVKLVRSPNPELAKLALRVVAEESFQRYMATFNKLDEKTRESAARAISKLDPTILDRLAGEIESLDSERRLKAIKIVEYAGAEEKLRPVLMDLLHDPDVKVRATAIKTIQLSSSIEGMRVLIDALNDKDRRIRSNAIEAFEEIGDQRFVGLLKPFLTDRDNRVRGNAAKAMWRLGQLEGRTTLETMLVDADPLMRMSAAWAMGEIASSSFRPALAERARSETDERVQKRIREAVEEIDRGGSEG